jgi:O-antigen ligase
MTGAMELRIRGSLLCLLAMATGAYNLAPGVGYLIFGVATLALLTQARWIDAPGRWFEPHRAAGVLVFAATTLLGATAFGIDGRAAVVPLFAVSMFSVAYSLTRLALGSADVRVPASADRIALAGLAVLLTGQVLGAFGFINLDDRLIELNEDALLFRPGGFLNPNMTASVALLLVLMTTPHAREQLGWQLVAAIALATVIVMLTQSRAALVAWAIYLPWILRRHWRGMLAVVLLAVTATWQVGWWSTDGLIHELSLAFGSRLRGDASSNERLWLVNEASRLVRDAPFFGRGQGFLVQRVGLGSHNQVLEWLLSYGAVGTLVLLAAAAAMIGPCSLIFLLVGVAPTFLFSHSFYDSASFQTALGMALAAERHRRPKEVAR